MAKASHSFVDKCLCKENQIKYQLPKGLERNAVDQTYCFHCLDRSHPETILVRLDWPGKSGLWGVKFNDAYFIEKDPKFSEEKERGYYEGLARRIKMLDPDNNQPIKFTVEGMQRNELLEMGSELSGENQVLLTDEKPTKLPKKIRRGKSESYRPFRDY